MNPLYLTALRHDTLLEKRGAPIGNADSLIAAHAQALGIVLVTNNKKHFGRVKNLRCEDWV